MSESKAKLKFQADRAHDIAQAMAQQTIAVFLRTAEAYFGEKIPLELLTHVQNGCNEFSKAQQAIGAEFTWAKLEAEVVRLTEEWKAAATAKIEARIDAANSGKLPIL